MASYLITAFEIWESPPSALLLLSMPVLLRVCSNGPQGVYKSSPYYARVLSFLYVCTYFKQIHDLSQCVRSCRQCSDTTPAWTVCEYATYDRCSGRP
ncbi:hypothetical protein GGR56DRAFT_94275 [Xylariaceae sp. FL0804]|nr:hypothetical protein GGR56DRAFT_94275 [Xylariaceae sp. FL0804]